MTHKVRKFRSIQDSDSPIPDITPIIDVVFILLIFFMLTSSFTKQNQININLPEAKNSAEQINYNVIDVFISRANKISVKNVVLKDNDSDTVREAFLPYISDVNSSIVISGDAETSYQTIITILDVSAKLGFERIRLNTKNLQD